MSDSPIGRLGSSWFLGPSLNSPDASHAPSERDLQHAGADHPSNSATGSDHGNSDSTPSTVADGSDHSKPSDAKTATQPQPDGDNPGTGNSRNVSGQPPGGAPPSRDSVNPRSAKDESPSGSSGSDQQPNAALGNRANGNGNGDIRSPQSSSPSSGDSASGFGKYDGKNAGWGDGNGGGQNKGVRLDNSNTSSMSGDGLLDDVGHALDTLLGRNSSYTASSVYESTNSSSQASLNSSSSQSSDGSRSDNQFDSPPGGDVAHDVGEAAASLLDGRSGNRVDPSNLTSRSFNDWANSRSDAQGTRNASTTSSTSEQMNAAPNRAANFTTNEEPPARLASPEEEEAALNFRADDRPTANLSARGVDEFEEPVIARAGTSEDSLLERLGRGDGTTNPSTTADAAKQAAGQNQEDGPEALLAQNRAAQSPADAARANGADDDAQSEAATLRQALAARGFETTTTRNLNSTDADVRQAAKDQAQQQTQNASYVGEGKQVVADANKTLIGTVQKVEAVAANVNTEYDEMKQNEHLDTQHILMRQFAPALVGISALISSALGGTTMIVSPGGSAAPFLLGVSALLFGMGAWRSSSMVRTQLAQEKTWAEMLGDPGARQSLLAAGVNSLGLAGSVGLSLLALV